MTTGIEQHNDLECSNASPRTAPAARCAVFGDRKRFIVSR
jgi:hypothetical protein